MVVRDEIAKNARRLFFAGHRSDSEFADPCCDVLYTIMGHYGLFPIFTSQLHAWK